MPSVYNYRHVELDKVGRGKRVIQPPGGQTADIFGIRSQPPSEAGAYSSASSQAGSDVASSRVHIETMSAASSVAGANNAGAPMDGPGSGSVSTIQSGQVSPSGSVGSASTNGQQPLLMAGGQPQATQLQQQQRMQSSNSIQQQKLMQIQQANEANRSPKKTIPVLRRNPITGEVLTDPSERQQAPIRVRQPPGGRSSGACPAGISTSQATPTSTFECFEPRRFERRYRILSMGNHAYDSTGRTVTTSYRH